MQQSRAFPLLTAAACVDNVIPVALEARLKMAINSWLESKKFHELHPLSVRLFVLNEAYQWERYIVCNDIMVPACVLNLCEVKTWEHFRIVCPLRTSVILQLIALASLLQT